MKTTIYNWNGFDECKPEDGQIILVQNINSPEERYFCEYIYELKVRKLTDNLFLVPIENYKWTNLD